MKDNKYQIGQKFKEIRKKSGLTQENFSEKICIEPSSLSNIEMVRVILQCKPF